MTFFEATKLQLHTTVLCLCTFLLAICSLPSPSDAKSCKCSGTDQDLSDRYTINTTFSKLDGDLFLLNPAGTLLLDSLGTYKNHRPSNFNLSAPGMLVIGEEIDLLAPDDNNGAAHKTSFSAMFTMNIYQPMMENGSMGVIFALIPQVDFYNSIALRRSSSHWYPTSRPYQAPLAGNQVIIQAGEFSWISANDTIICLNISIVPMETTIGVNYIISVDYIPLRNQLSIEVSVDAQGQPNPESLKASMSLNAVDYSSIWPYGLFTFSSSVGQLEKLKDWNLTVERFHENRGRKGSTAIIVSAVLGSAAATAVAAAVLYWYFNSRYRRYQKDLDQLAKSMQLLPGMPTKFNFTDIQKATCNFNEKMKLGQGGFGAVYRCRLLLKRGEVLQVAVKKFSRNKNRGYQDFLAEVSVINRLRHKNIVPLIGKDNKHLI
jgi:interleukin-1 receptor-associated kinase 1